MNLRLMSFTPRPGYFFGDHFGFDDIYVVHSKQVPPVSTVLGAIRYAILKQNGCLQMDSDKKESLTEKGIAEKTELIGKFDYHICPEGDLGKIKSITPVMVGRKTSMGVELFYPLPCNMQADKGILRKCSIVKRDKVLNNFMTVPRDYFFEMDGYDCKVGNTIVWARTDRWLDIAQGRFTALVHKQDYLLSEDIFTEEMNVGIRRDRGKNKDTAQFEYSSDKDDRGFFQKQSFRFKHGNFCFCVLADLEDGFMIADSIVRMGGEQSLFQMESQEFSGKQDELVSALISPCERLNQNRHYCLLSETNIPGTTDNKVYIINAGLMNRARRLHLFKPNDRSNVPARMRIKGDVTRSLPIGSVFIVQGDVNITAQVNHIAGYDRFIEIGG